jgi:trigger factor
MNRLIAQAASQYRGEDQKRFLQAVQENPMFAAQIRAPLYEDKVVDFLFSTADITDRKATREQLEADLESEEGHVHGPGCGHDHSAEKPKAKKSAAKAKPKAEPKAEAKEPIPTKAKPAAKKADIVEKAEKPKPAKPAKSEPANKAAAKAVASKAEAKPAAKPKKPAKKA